MPSLTEGIQYVGMIRPITTDYDYILTDIYGHIDCFSAGVGQFLNLTPQLFRENSQINIQLLAPELITVFEQKGDEKVEQSNEAQSFEHQRWGRRSSTNVAQATLSQARFIKNNKYSLPGGDALTFYLPQNFLQFVKSEKPNTKQNRANSKNKRGGTIHDENHLPIANSQSSKLIKSPPFRDFQKYLTKRRAKHEKGPDLKKLLQCKEYRESEIKKAVNIEIREWFMPVGNKEEAGLKVLVFMISKNGTEKAPHDLGSFEEGKVHQVKAQQVQQQQSPQPQQTLSQEDASPANFTQLSTFAQSKGKNPAPKHPGAFIPASKLSFVDHPTPFAAQIANQNNMQSALSFNDLGPKQHLEPLTPIREEDSMRSPDLIKKRVNQNSLKLNLKPQQPQPINDFGEERTEDDEMLKETPRIDVKFEIAINDNAKSESKVFSDSYRSDSKDSKEEEPNEEQNLKKAESSNNQKEVAGDQEEPESIGDSEGAEDDEDSDYYGENEDGDGDDDEDGEEGADSEGSQEDLMGRRSQQSRSQKQGSDAYTGGSQSNLDRQQTQQQNQQPLKKVKIHDYSKIVTNPKYKYFDEETCGSAYFNDCNCSERERDIRDMIKKNENKKKRREKRHKKKEEEEKAKAKGNQVDAEEEKAEEDKEEPDEEEKKEEKLVSEKSDVKKKRRRRRDDSKSGGGSRSRSRSRKSDSSEGQQKETQGLKDKDKDSDNGAMDQPNDEGEVSSVASSAQSQTRTFYSLRLAVDEKYVPVSIKNLNTVANIVFLLIAMLAIVYYAIQETLFTNIDTQISIIVNSENRVGDIVSINLKLNDLSMIYENYLSPSNYAQPRDQLIALYRSEFINSSSNLLVAQTNLSLATASLNVNSRLQINPDNVTLVYQSLNTALPSSYQFNIWEAVIEIVAYCYQLGENGTAFYQNNTMVAFVFENCMNSVMSALKQSTNAMIAESASTRSTNISIFLYLLISVSCALLLSMSFLLPVIRRAKSSRQEVFELFTHKKIEKSIDEQLKKCRWFITKYQSQQESHNGGGNYEAELNENAVEENTHIPEKEMKADDDKQTEYYKNYNKKKKKWKQLNNNIGMITIRFFVILLLIEAFFLVSYLLSKTFLERVADLTNELTLLLSRQPSLTLLLLMEKQMFYSNNTAQFEFQDVESLLDTLYQQQYEDEQSLLKAFTSNYYFHSTSYNTDFNSLIYQSVCDNLNLDNLTLSACISFNDGILQKGIYSAIVKYWSQLSQLRYDFFGTSRHQSDIITFINNQKLIINEQMVDIYFKQAHSYLIQVLQDDISQFFSKQFYQIRVIFVVYILYICFIYFFIWRIFLQRLMDEIWKAKSALSVLPIDLCFRIEEIRTFIYRNSSSFAVQQ